MLALRLGRLAARGDGGDDWLARHGREDIILSIVSANTTMSSSVVGMLLLSLIVVAGMMLVRPLRCGFVMAVAPRQLVVHLRGVVQADFITEHNNFHLQLRDAGVVGLLVHALLSQRLGRLDGLVLYVRNVHGDMFPYAFFPILLLRAFHGSDLLLLLL